MIGVRAVVFGAALAAASCGAPLMTLPAGPGEPAQDGAALLAQATAACAGVSSLSAELAIRGSVDGGRLRGRLLVGVAGSDGMYIEAPAPFGAPLFVLGATAGASTLLMPRDRRVVQHGDAGELLEAIAGVRLDGPALRATLTGCVSVPEPSAGDARSLGPNWRVLAGPPTLYLRRERADQPWRLVAVLRPGADGWRTDYSAFVDAVPHRVHLVSNTARRFDLRLESSQLDLNPNLDPSTFRVAVPAGTQAMTLDELRAGGPLSK